MASKFCISICLFALALTLIDCECPIDWAGFKDMCYWFSRDIQTYTDALTACRNMGAHLVTDDSAEKHNFLREFLSVFSSMKIKSFWTGASDFAKEGTWVWIGNGAEVGPYLNWGPGQPDGNNTANCMVLTWYNSTLAWADAQCNPHSHHHKASGSHYICEKSLSSFVTP